MKQKFYRDIGCFMATLGMLSIFSNIGNIFVTEEFPFFSPWTISVCFISSFVLLLIYLFYHEIKQMDPEKLFFGKEEKKLFKIFLFLAGIGLAISGIYGLIALAKIGGAGPKDSWFMMGQFIAGMSTLVILAIKRNITLFSNKNY